MTLGDHTAPITALDFTEPYGMLVTAGQDDVVKVWDLCDGDQIGTLRGHQGEWPSAHGMGRPSSSGTNQITYPVSSTPTLSLSLQAPSKRFKSKTHSASPVGPTERSDSGTCAKSRITKRN